MSPFIVSSADPTRADGFVQLGYADRASCSELVPVFAPTDGVVTYSAHSDGGGLLYLDHPGGWSTSCSGLETVLTPSTDRCSRRRKSRVRAGDVLGYVRRKLRLGFGLSRWIDGDWKTDGQANAAVETPDTSTTLPLLRLTMR